MSHGRNKNPGVMVAGDSTAVRGNKIDLPRSSQPEGELLKVFSLWSSAKQTAGCSDK